MVKKRELRVMICMMTACLAAMAHHHQQLLILSASRMDEDEAVGNDDQEEDVHDDDREEPKKKRTRCSYGRPDYNSSEWAVMLKKAHLLADPTTEEAKSFRTSFRVPYPFFLDLVENVKAGEWEGFMANTTGVGRLNYICVELKVCGTAFLWSVETALTACVIIRRASVFPRRSIREQRTSGSIFLAVHTSTYCPGVVFLILIPGTCSDFLFSKFSYI